MSIGGRKRPDDAPEYANIMVPMLGAHNRGERNKLKYRGEDTVTVDHTERGDTDCPTATTKANHSTLDMRSTKAVAAVFDTIYVPC